MRIKISEKLEIPKGIQCEFSNNMITCRKDSETLSKRIAIQGVLVRIEENSIVFDCPAGNKNHLKKIMSLIAHLKNMLKGISEKFVYKLEACNVHFPMTLKIEGSKMIINNFLGEKVSRYAKIIPGADVQVKGAVITVSSSSRDIAGQTAANIEKATRVRNKDRRIFQDGIYIVEKAGRAI